MVSLGDDQISKAESSTPALMLIKENWLLKSYEITKETMALMTHNVYLALGLHGFENCEKCISSIYVTQFIELCYKSKKFYLSVVESYR